MTIKVPKSALRISGNYPGGPDDEEIMPEVNDPVSFNVDGVVVGESGETCEVEVRLINGKRPEAPSDKKKEKSKPKETNEEPDENALRKMAEEADGGAY